MSRGWQIGLWALGLFYVVAGTFHFTATAEYLKMMPPYLPFHLELVYLSGLAEIVLGIAVLIPALRRWAAWGIILLLIAVFPANIYIAMENVPLFGSPEGAGIWNWIRLPFQLVLVWWAWHYTREGRAGSPATA